MWQSPREQFLWTVIFCMCILWNDKKEFLWKISQSLYRENKADKLTDVLKGQITCFLLKGGNCWQIHEHFTRANRELTIAGLQPSSTVGNVRNKIKLPILPFLSTGLYLFIYFLWKHKMMLKMSTRNLEFVFLSSTLPEL